MNKSTTMKVFAVTFVVFDIIIALICFNFWEVVTFMCFGFIGYILGSSFTKERLLETNAEKEKIFRVSKKAMEMTLIVFLVLGVTACSKKIPAPKPMEEVYNNEFKGAPDWITKSCSTYCKENKMAAICGVGSIGGSRNVSLMRIAATARARTDLARTFQVKVEAMLKDYQATTTGGEEFGKSAADEQHFVSVTRQITDMTLSGTEVSGIWLSPNGTFYALATMDVEKFKAAISQMNNLSESVRKAVIERADEAFDELDLEIENSRAQK
jgi:hypothetical protein